MGGHWAIAGMVVLLPAGVLLADLYFAPGSPLPAAPYAVPILIAEGRVTLANAAGLRLIGQDSIEALQVRQPEGWPLSLGKGPLGRALAGEVVVHHEETVRNPHTGRAVYLRTSATPIRNAIRYSPRGGEVDVEVALRAGEAVVSVTDQGVGIPREKQARIFQRFYRAHTGTPYDYGGMGVGLYIAREIVARHDGTMWFESEEGKRSTFHFSFPPGGGHGRE